MSSWTLTGLVGRTPGILINHTLMLDHLFRNSFSLQGYAALQEGRPSCCRRECGQEHSRWSTCSLYILLLITWLAIERRSCVLMDYISSWQQVLTQRGRRSTTSGIASLAEEDGIIPHPRERKYYAMRAFTPLKRIITLKSS